MEKKKKNRIRESAEEILDSFTEVEEGLPTEKETYYEQDKLNVLKPDGDPKKTEDLQKFQSRFLSIMPEKDEDGSLIVEVAEWTE